MSTDEDLEPMVRLADLDPHQGVFVLRSCLADPASILCFGMDEDRDLAFDDGRDHPEADEWALVHLSHLVDGLGIGHLLIRPRCSYQRVASGWVATGFGC